MPRIKDQRMWCPDSIQQAVVVVVVVGGGGRRTVRRVEVQEKEREAAFVAAETTVFVSQQHGGQGPPMSRKQRLEAPLCTDVRTQQWNKKAIVGILQKERDEHTQCCCAHTDTHNGSRRTVVGTVYSKHRWRDGKIKRVFVARD